MMISWYPVVGDHQVIIGASFSVLPVWTGNHQANNYTTEKNTDPVVSTLKGKLNNTIIVLFFYLPSLHASK